MERNLKSVQSMTVSHSLMCYIPEVKRNVVLTTVTVIWCEGLSSKEEGRYGTLEGAHDGDKENSTDFQ